jgi:hypothetical protein
MSVKSIVRRPAVSLLALLVVILPLAVAGCKSRRSVEANDVSVSFEVNRNRAPLGSAVEVSYTFTTGPSFKKLSEDYRAFVQFRDSQGKILPFQDDHTPNPAPNTWEPGKTYRYSRTVFIPVYPYVGDAQVEIGLYPASGHGERVGMKGDDSGMRAYKVGKIELLPQTENIFLVYKDGWHGPESSPTNTNVERTWTKKDALVSFKNPKEDVILYLEADTNYKAFATPPVLTVSVGSGAGTVVPIESSDIFLKKIRFKAEALGKDEWVDLHLSMNQSFVPKAMQMNQDDRELGLLVYHLYVGSAEQLGTVPPTTVVDAGTVSAPAPAKAGAAAKAAAPAGRPAAASKKS